MSELTHSRARLAGRSERRREARAAYFFLFPALAVLTLFVFGPLVFIFVVAFFDWNLFRPEQHFLGVENFVELAGDELFFTSLRNTTAYVLGVVPAQTLLALVLALAVNRNIPARGFFRAAFYIPAITSSVVTSIIFLWIYSKPGLLNYILSRFGIAGPDWIGSPRYALGAIMALNVWSTSGYFMVALLAGLQNIPASLYEAARLDGAGPWARFRHVTLPGLGPTLFFVVTLGIIGCFQVFDQIYMMSAGGPVNATTTLSYFIYNSAFRYFRFGYAAAAAVVLFAIILLVTGIQRKIVRPEAP
ncbi:ABC-type transporter, integral membrane subunit [Methylocaldum marinum]|uniref:ABC-type transporter, integral membrane subunit n=1 Tax=Methylocaldum marinum TaxID=1432792 RepID=A0A250KTI5_9GAMM|nr:sugar ABC transporter permease [Methylocaldum marinum]BBA34968.1 ABC-type transporter, integral membrane subunit [Methylocaldum marinum]